MRRAAAVCLLRSAIHVITIGVLLISFNFLDVAASPGSCSI